MTTLLRNLVVSVLLLYAGAVCAAPGLTPGENRIACGASSCKQGYRCDLESVPCAEDVLASECVREVCVKKKKSEVRKRVSVKHGRS